MSAETWSADPLGSGPPWGEHDDFIPDPGQRHMEDIQTWSAVKVKKYKWKTEKEKASKRCYYCLRDMRKQGCAHLKKKKDSI